MKLLAVKLSSLGDLFHALPVVRCLKAGTGACVDWVTQEEYGDLVDCFDDVDRVLRFPRRGLRQSGAAFVRELRERQYDAVVDLQGLLKSAVITRLARSKRRIGPSFHRECSRLLYSEVAGERNLERHAVVRGLDMVRYLGLDAEPVEFPVTFPKAVVSTPGLCIGLVPVSRWPSKNWPASCYTELVRRLRSTIDFTTYLLGSAADRAACDEIASGLGDGVVNLAGQTTLPEMGGYLAEMDLLVANDSGPVHMAAACGTRALVVFGPTDPVRTGPYGEGHRVVRAELPCEPCFSRVCRRQGVPCLAKVTPERVGEVALEMLGKQRG